MRIRSNLRGTKGFVVAYERLIRFRYMLSDKAKERIRILAFWDKYGTQATIEAFGGSERSLKRWQAALKKGGGKLESLNPQSTAPRSRNKRQVEVWVEEFVIKERTLHPRLGEEKLHALLIQEGYADSVSTVGRILDDLKAKGRLPTKVKVSVSGKTGRMIERKPRKIKPKLRRPQSVRVLELDTVVRYIDGIKRYLLTAVDTKTRVAFAGAYTNHGSGSAADFLRRCQEVIPDCPCHIQTDNGSEFAKYFAQTASTLGLTHYHTYPQTPKMNAHVERFNRTVSEEFIIYHRALFRDDVSNFNQELIEWLLWYNGRRPHHALGLKSPFSCMIEGLEVVECQRWWTDTITC
jgi:transposase InsO family protein